MLAYISGSSGVAILNDGDSWSCLFAVDPGEVKSIDPVDIRHILRGAKDIATVDCASIDEAREKFELALDRDENMQLALGLLDSELSDKLRREIVDGLEFDFKNKETVNEIEKIFWARELPENADVETAREISISAGAENVVAFLDRLIKRQPYIRRARIAWDAIPDVTFKTDENQRKAHGVAVHEGLFRKLSETLAEGKNTGAFILDCLFLPTVKEISNYSDIFITWVRQFKTRAAIDDAVLEQLQQEDLATEEGELYDRGKERDNRSRGILKIVEAQKFAILRELKKKDGGNYHRFLNDLIEYHNRESEPVHLCKTLSHLAVQAKEMGLFQVQLELTAESIKAKPDDGWALAQHGYALLKNGKYEAALDAYKKADAFCIGQDSIVAKTGRAEVLKAMGRNEEALVAYDMVIKEHPENSVAKTGRVCVLSLLDRDDEAIACLPYGNIKTYDDWIGYHIRGMIELKRKNFVEARRIFEDGIENNPFVNERDYFKNALALVNMQENKYKDALAVLDTVSSQRLFTSKNILRLHICGLEGDKQCAIEAYDQIQTRKTSENELQVTNELHRRYIVCEQPQHTDEWVVKEFALSLMQALSIAA